MRCLECSRKMKLRDLCEEVNLFKCSHCQSEYYLSVPDRLIDHKENAAYLDIETTGLFSRHRMTVIGAYVIQGKDQIIIQLTQDAISKKKIRQLIRNVEIVYTFNGRSFENTFIKRELGIDLNVHCLHIDMRWDVCYPRGYKCNMKEIERVLKVKRKHSFTGSDAPRLWKHYKELGDAEALVNLLKYNREDVYNLRMIRLKIEGT